MTPSPDETLPERSGGLRADTTPASSSASPGTPSHDVPQDGPAADGGTPHASERESGADDEAARPREIGGQAGPEPTRYGDWEKKGRCTDF